MRATERHTDAELLARCKKDRSAFAAFYRRHERLILSYLLARCRDPELAADLAAETFARVLEAADRFDPARAAGQSAIPWILAIARNTLLLSIRRGSVADDARRRIGLEPLVLGDEDLARVEELASIDPRVDEALEDLPPQLRDPLVARVLDERDYEEIAAQLGCSEQVVRKRVSRGLSRLRAALTPSNS